MSGSWKRLVLLPLMLNLFNEAAAGLQTYGVQDLCGSSIELKSPIFDFQSSAIIKPTVFDSYRENKDCFLVVKRYLPRYELVVSIRTLDFRPNGADSLKISYRDGFDRSETFRNYDSDRSRYHDPTEPRTFRSSDDVTLTFSTKTGPYGTASYEGFEVTVTVVQRTPCEAFQFRCNSGVCISDQLQCDGHNHCGDSSSQQSCSTSNTGRTVGIAVGVISGIVVLIVCCYLMKKCDCDDSPSTTYRATGMGNYAINSSGPYRSSYSYDGESATTGYSAYESTYGGGDASGGYSAYESTYGGGDASGGYSAYESTYGGDSAAGCYSASESTYEGSSAAGCSPAY